MLVYNIFFGQIVLGTLGYGINQSKTTTVLQLEKRKNIPRDDGRDGYSMVCLNFKHFFLFSFYLCHMLFLDTI